MRYRTHLAWLALSIEEGTPGTVVFLITNCRTRVPEFLGIRLIGYILKQAADLAVLDLEAELTAELEVAGCRSTVASPTKSYESYKLINPIPNSSYFMLVHL